MNCKKDVLRPVSLSVCCRVMRELEEFAAGQKDKDSMAEMSPEALIEKGTALMRDERRYEDATECAAAS